MMHPVSTEDLLNAWESGLHQPMVQRTLILLTVAHPDVPIHELMTTSIGQRDRMLIQFRQRLFGYRLMNTTHCPQCDELIEWENSTQELLDLSPSHNLQSQPADENSFTLNSGEYVLQFRLPNSEDLCKLPLQEDHDTQQMEAQTQLLQCCVIQAERQGKTCQARDLPDEVVDQLCQEIEHLDPHADIRMQLSCPQCSHQWDSLFDISHFLWNEINDWAQQMLQSIGLLASAFGWSEGEILKLSPLRRQLYLGMITQ